MFSKSIKPLRTDNRLEFFKKKNLNYISYIMGFWGIDLMLESLKEMMLHKGWTTQITRCMLSQAGQALFGTKQCLLHAID